MSDERAARWSSAFIWLRIGGGVLVAAALGLLASVAPINPSGIAPQHWIDTHAFALTWAGELLFFAVVAWGAGAVGAYGAARADAPLRSAIALVGLAVALAAFLIVLLALGRLVYPVVDADLSDDLIILIASLVTGAVHLALLGLAVVAFATPLALGPGRTGLLLGILFGVVFLVGSFPWLLPQWTNFAVAAAVAAWAPLPPARPTHPTHHSVGEHASN